MVSVLELKYRLVRSPEMRYLKSWKTASKLLTVFCEIWMHSKDNQYPLGLMDLVDHDQIEHVLF